MNHQSMNHPKMKYTYVGIDSHKDTHTAVFLDCFFEKLGQIVFENLPSKFPKFLSDAEFLKLDGTELFFGLEDVSDYGRNLTAFLGNNGQPVKHVNALFVARERKNQSVTQKTDSLDAECAARVLLNKFNELPDVKLNDKYWVLRSLVVRRNYILENNMALKNQLHSLLSQHYPNYRNFFPNIEIKSSLAFFARYPSPRLLSGVTVEELTEFFSQTAKGRVGAGKSGKVRAEQILENVENTAVEFQEIRDMTVQSTIRQIQFNLDEIEKLNKLTEELLEKFNCTLLSMIGIETATAAKLLSCIGDIRRFSSPAKLAKYAGIAPVTYASGKKEGKYANQRGNRELNAIFFDIAVKVSMYVGINHKVLNPYFYEYYKRKQSEGKTKRQAMKCVQRRLVNIIWGMLTYGRDYDNPEMYWLPKEEKRG